MICYGKIEIGKTTTNCNHGIWKCKKCGAIGCDNSKCKNQKINSLRCTICNTTNPERL